MLRAVLDAVSTWAIPVLLAGIPLFAIARRVKVYPAFVEGAKQGFETAVRVIPPLVAILVALGMLRASGAMDGLTR
ncbi:MAG TPA: spore maturation protein, partial [Anaeromyxobacter sp.]|nr:spore maturation protein [Anaeromyxobacter sp.]